MNEIERAANNKRNSIIAVIALLLISSFAFFGQSKDQSSSSSSSSSPRIITPEQALSIVRGCCSGSGGTYSSTGQDCVMPDIRAFTACVGDGDAVIVTEGVT